MIGLLGVILSVVILAPFVGSLDAGSYSGAAGAATNAVVCALLLVAYSTRNAIFYLPFLMLNVS